MDVETVVRCVYGAAKPVAIDELIIEIIARIENIVNEIFYIHFFTIIIATPQFSTIICSVNEIPLLTKKKDVVVVD
jgi:hypothetical protein